MFKKSDVIHFFNYIISNNNNSNHSIILIMHQNYIINSYSSNI